MEQIRDRLRRVEERLDVVVDELHGVDARTGRIEATLSELRDDLRGVIREIGGVSAGNGSHRPLRSRIHTLESDSAAASAAEAALAAARAMRRDGWTTRQKTIVTVFAGLGALGTLVSTVVLVITGGGS